MQSPHKRSFAAEELARRQKKRPAIIAIIVIAVVIVAVAVGYALYMRYGAKEVPTEAVAPPAEKIKSIAVLPFVDMSPEKDQVNLGDGIADHIISKLTQMRELRVIDRTSSFEFRGKENAIDEIGDKLDVGAVLEGSFQKSGNRLRIIAQLIKVEDHSHIFSYTYMSEINDIFAIQDSISMAVVEEIKGTVLKEEKAAIEKRYTDNLEAWELYLLSLQLKESREERLKAIDYLQQAIEKDPNFALAYAAIARIYNRMGYGYQMQPAEAYSQARNYAKKALEIDDDLAEAYTQLAWTNLYYDWNWSAAESAFRRAIELNPGNAEAHRLYKDYYMVMGNFNEALKELQRAHELNPVQVSLGYVAYMYVMANRYNEAEDLIEKAGLLNPNDDWIHTAMYYMYSRQGNYEKLLDVLRRYCALYGYTETDYPSMFGYVYAKLGWREKAEHSIELMEKMDPVPAYFVARTYLGLGEIDRTFKWLEKMYEERNSWLPYINSFQEWDPIRSDPRFKALLKKMGLPEN